MTLILAALGMFSIPFIVIIVVAVRLWIGDRRQARELDRTLDRILSGRSRPSQSDRREWRIS